MTEYDAITRAALRRDRHIAQLQQALRTTAVAFFMILGFWLLATFVQAAAFARANPDLLLGPTPINLFAAQP